MKTSTIGLILMLIIVVVGIVPDFIRKIIKLFTKSKNDKGRK